MKTNLELTEDEEIIEALLSKSTQMEFSYEPPNNLFTRPIIDLRIGAYIAVLVNERAYRIERKTYTFGEFISNYFISKISLKWLRKEWSKVFSKIHPIAKWIKAYSDGSLNENIITHFVRLSYDIYTIENHCSYQVNLYRLLDKNQFWGYRYELLVATIFLEAGFEIEWLKPTGGKIVEFNARHVESNNLWAVECKSRHGLNFSNVETSLKRLQKKARDKNPGLPLMIFVDANVSINDFNTIIFNFQEYKIKENQMIDNNPIHIYITNILDRGNEGWPRMPYIHAVNVENEKNDDFLHIMTRFHQYPSHFDIDQKLG